MLTPKHVGHQRNRHPSDILETDSGLASKEHVAIRDAITFSATAIKVSCIQVSKTTHTINKGWLAAGPRVEFER